MSRSPVTTVVSMPRGVQVAGDRADDVVGLVAGHLVDGDAQRGHDLANLGELRAQVVRHRRASGLVVGELLVAEGGPGQVEAGGHVLRPDVLDAAQEDAAEAEDGVDQLALARRQRRQGVVAAVDEAVAVEQHQASHAGLELDWRRQRARASAGGRTVADRLPIRCKCSPRPARRLAARSASQRASRMAGPSRKSIPRARAAVDPPRTISRPSHPDCRTSSRQPARRVGRSVPRRWRCRPGNGRRPGRRAIVERSRRCWAGGLGRLCRYRRGGRRGRGVRTDGCCRPAPGPGQRWPPPAAALLLDRAGVQRRRLSDGPKDGQREGHRPGPRSRARPLPRRTSAVRPSPRSRARKRWRGRSRAASPSVRLKSRGRAGTGSAAVASAIAPRSAKRAAHSSQPAISSRARGSLTIVHVAAVQAGDQQLVVCGVVRQRFSASRSSDDLSHGTVPDSGPERCRSARRPRWMRDFTVPTETRMIPAISA